MTRFVIAFLAFLAGSSVAAAEPLNEASRSGSNDEVLALIDAGANLDAQGNNGETPLIEAILGGHGTVASLLIERGADVRARNEGGFTPLHAAAFVDDDAIAAVLLDRGADVNDQGNKAGVTPLSVAAEQGSLGVAKLLIDRDADLEASEMNGYTPLTRAIWRGREDIVVLLQTAGAKCQSAEILEEPTYTACMAGQP